MAYYRLIPNYPCYPFFLVIFSTVFILPMFSRREVHVILFDSSGFDSVNFCQVFCFVSLHKQARH